MAGNANSVNIKSGKDYHHGDLRASALALGLEKLASQEDPDIGLRELARDLGVSATALYRHFPNKDSLLDSLALAALRKLGGWQADAGQKAGGGRDGFRAVGLAYVEWAQANPALFRLIFARTGRVDALMGEGHDLGEAFAQLRAGITEVVGQDAEPGKRLAAQLHAWSLVHGLAHLVIDGQVEYQPDLMKAVIDGTFGLDQSTG